MGKGVIREAHEPVVVQTREEECGLPGEATL